MLINSDANQEASTAVRAKAKSKEQATCKMQASQVSGVTEGLQSSHFASSSKLVGAPIISLVRLPTSTC